MLLKDQICTLRPVSQDDIARSLIWRNDPLIKKDLQTYRLPITKPMEDDWIENAMNGDQDRVVFAIDENSSHQHVGFIELNSIDYFNRSGQFAIVIGDVSAQGKGIGMSATRQLLDYGFNQLNLNKVYLQVAEYNRTALGLYEKMGFITEGTIRSQYFKDGAYFDMIAMGLLASEFTA